MEFSLDQIIASWGGFIPPSEHPFPEHVENARKIAADGMVLLKNENKALPLKPGKVALFGAGAVDTVTCGTGSGYVTAPMVTVRDGLLDAGFTVTSERWIDRFNEESKAANDADTTLSYLDRFFSGRKILIDDPLITDDELAEAKEADTAIYVIRRNAGENGDRIADKGDYYLSDAEEQNIRKVAGSFGKTIVILNTCVIDATFLDEIPGIQAAVLMGLPGMQAGHALADVLTGKKNPAGKLTDTWARKYSDYPASATFSLNDGDPHQEDYNEDIFVGYRYFDTFGIEPLYPFGYGLSYTDFELNFTGFEADWDKVCIKIAVRNTGDVSGREVAQVYVTAPEGRLTKPYQELKGFAKTCELAPGETEELTIEIPTGSLASYDEEKAAFVMEAGDYLFHIGNSSRNTFTAAILKLDAEAVTLQLRNELQPDHSLDRLVAPKRDDENCTPGYCAEICAADCVTADRACRTVEAEERAANRKRFDDAPEDRKATLIDVKEGRVSMESFINSLEPEVLLKLVTGIANETPYEAEKRLDIDVHKVNGPSSSGELTSLFVESLGIPNFKMTDGPSGLHLGFCQTTCNPVGMVIAQTFDREEAKLSGVSIGKELAFYHQAVILGPGMNIHRDPLCGRNFEYFSEDPLLTGAMGTEITRGVQRTPGVGVSIKHFCCNNQEEDRASGNSTVSERALREIYLKGFEMTVKEADPMTIMTSYNCLNGTHTSSRYDLLTEVVRGEWGFKGLIMTDWGSQSSKPYDYHAGNDLIMGGYRADFLMAAMTGKAPEFDEDGSVAFKDYPIYGGFMTDHVEFWNSFEPGKDGNDTVSTEVPADTDLGESVLKAVEEGFASVKEHTDGSRTVTYKGIDRGQWLDLYDVKACAARVLEMIMNSISWDLFK
ncbi:MAG: glycoside hydrolase family 3 C-terminal domain-containing protein [Oscillospiraceae bacterium]|nr:glycoside hydrolase family 3 C-terminal domain-containing protein [Oscillospiraceae bacterium]